MNNKTVIYGDLHKYYVDITNSRIAEATGLVVNLKRYLTIVDTKIVNVPGNSTVRVEFEYVYENTGGSHDMHIEIEPKYNLTVSNNSKTITHTWVKNLSDVIIQGNIITVSNVLQGTNFLLGYLLKNNDNINPQYKVYADLVIPDGCFLTRTAHQISNLTEEAPNIYTLPGGLSGTLRYYIRAGDIPFNQIQLNIANSLTYITPKVVTYNTLSEAIQILPNASGYLVTDEEAFPIPTGNQFIIYLPIQNNYLDRNFSFLEAFLENVDGNFDFGVANLKEFNLAAGEFKVLEWTVTAGTIGGTIRCNFNTKSDFILPVNVTVI